MELIKSGKKMSKLFWINFWGYSYRISLFNMSIAHSDYIVMDQIFRDWARVGTSLNLWYMGWELALSETRILEKKNINI